MYIGGSGVLKRMAGLEEPETEFYCNVCRKPV